MTREIATNDRQTISSAQPGAGSSERLRALFLDVGETLVYPHPSPAELIASVCDSAGYRVTVDEIERAEAAVGPQIAARQSAGGELYSLSADSSRRFWTWVYALLLEALDAPVALREDLADRFHTAFNTIETWRLYEDSIPLLEALQPHRRAGLTLGIISNWEGWLEALLAHLAIDHYFDFAIISSSAGLEKPDPAIFHSALKRADVTAAEAAHVGDSLLADVGGALSVGIAPVLLDRRGRYTAAPDRIPQGVRVIASLEELLPFLAPRLAPSLASS